MLIFCPSALFALRVSTQGQVGSDNRIDFSPGKLGGNGRSLQKVVLALRIFLVLYCCGN